MVDGTRVLPGLTTPHDWHAVRSVEVAAVIDALAAENDALVVDIGHGIEELPVVTGEGRHATSRTALAAADVVVAVALPTPIGVARLLQWVTEARGIAPDAVIHVVVNRVDAGRSVRGDLESEIRRVLDAATVSFLPADPRVPRAAWDGRLVGDGPFGRSITDWVARHVPAVVGASP